MSDRSIGDPPDALEGTDDLRERVAADRLLAATDFDGTLAGIVEEPEDAAIRDDARDALLRLADAPGTDVAVVSGRGLADLREHVALDRAPDAGQEGPDADAADADAVDAADADAADADAADDAPEVAYAGNHGLEIVAGDRRHVHPAAEDARDALEAALDAISTVVTDIPGARIEDKELSATVHHREVDDPDAVARLEDAVRDAAADADALEVHGAKQALELRPAVDWHKGRAIEWLLEELADGDATALYLGDDETDEDGFRAIGDDGVTVRVGDAETVAEWRLPDPEAVAAFLDWLADVRETVGE